MPQMDGFDVAGSYQPDFPWEWSRGLGHTLAVAKVSEDDHFSDPWWQRNRDAIDQNGFRFRGGYHWVGKASWKDQLQRFQKGFGHVLPVGWCIQLDIEERGLLPDAVKDVVRAFDDEYGGDRLLIYMGRYYHSGGGYWIEDEFFGKYSWWLPWYPPLGSNTTFKDIQPKLPRTPTVWQWGGGREGMVVPSYDPPKRCDSNQVIRSDSLLVACGLLEEPAPETAPIDPTPITPEVVAVETNLPVLRVGSSGMQVKMLQSTLNLKSGSTLVVDGSFGPITHFIVCGWQVKRKLTVDGIVGPVTWKSLLEAT